jgi:tetratricopeptide (TPR) repeat protein
MNDATTRRARRPLAWLGAGVPLATAGACLWYWLAAAAPPRPDLAGAEPAVVEAVEQARRAVDDSPRSGDAWGELGMVLFANGFGAEAHACFVEAERRDPESPVWPYLQAWRLLVRDRAAALPALRRAVERTAASDPDNPTPRLVLAEALLENDERAEAEALCRQVLARDPSSARARFDLGLTLRAAGDAAGSEPHFRATLGSPYAGRRACLELAASRFRRGDADSAVALQRSAARLPEDRGWPDAYVARAKERAAGRQRRLQEAERLAADARHDEHVRTLAALADGGDGQAGADLGIALARAGDYAAAESALRDALARAPDLVAGHYGLGIVLLRQSERLGDTPAGRAKLADAAESLRRALALKPTHGLAHLYLGDARRRLGKLNEAISAYRAAVGCRPDLAEAHLRLGEALGAAGARAEAVRHLEHARRLAPADPRPAAVLARLGASRRNLPTKTRRAAS